MYFIRLQNISWHVFHLLNIDRVGDIRIRSREIPLCGTDCGKLEVYQSRNKDFSVTYSRELIGVRDRLHDTPRGDECFHFYQTRGNNKTSYEIRVVVCFAESLYPESQAHQPVNVLEMKLKRVRKL